MSEDKRKQHEGPDEQPQHGEQPAPKQFPFAPQSPRKPASQPQNQSQQSPQFPFSPGGSPSFQNPSPPPKQANFPFAPKQSDVPQPEQISEPDHEEPSPEQAVPPPPPFAPRQGETRAKPSMPWAPASGKEQEHPAPPPPENTVQSITPVDYERKVQEALGQIPDENGSPPSAGGYYANPYDVPGGDDLVDYRAGGMEIEVPSEPFKPPETMPPQAIFASIGAAVISGLVWVVVANTILGWMVWTWIIGLAMIGAAVGTAAAKFGGSGERMGFVCAIIAFIAMFVSGILSWVVAFLLMALGSAAPMEKQINAQNEDIDFVAQTLVETADTLDRSFAPPGSSQRPQFGAEDYAFDEYAVESTVAEGYMTEDGTYVEGAPPPEDNSSAGGEQSYQASVSAGAQSSGASQQTPALRQPGFATPKPMAPSVSFLDILWDIFFLFNCWGLTGMIIGVVSAYKIGSGLNQTGYQ